jgi:hypothetical protein
VGQELEIEGALFPPPSELAATIGGEYEAQCRELCFGLDRSGDEHLARFREMRRLFYAADDWARQVRTGKA